MNELLADFDAHSDINYTLKRLYSQVYDGIESGLVTDVTFKRKFKQVPEYVNKNASTKNSLSKQTNDLLKSLGYETEL